MECSICGHEFDPDEERLLITCEHGSMMCPCGVYGYACMWHQWQAPETNGKHEPIRLTVTQLPGDWTLETVSAGPDVLSIGMRQPAAAMGSHEDEL